MTAAAEKLPPAPTRMLLKPRPMSSNVLGHGYDPASRTLRVQFLRGGVYDYADVPPDVVDGLEASSSPGSYLAGVIRPHYRVTKRDPAEVQGLLDPPDA